MVNRGKAELDSKQVFKLECYQLDIREGKVRLTLACLQIQKSRNCSPNLPARSDIDVPDRVANRYRKCPPETNTVPLESNWRVPESLEKVIPIPRSLHLYLQWWPQEENIFQGQSLHPLSHALQIFTDASEEGWGAHLGEYTERGTGFLPENKLHMHYLEVKAVNLALKEL